MEIECQGCGKPFQAASERAKFCKRPECKKVRARARKQRQLMLDNVTELHRAAESEDGDLAKTTRAKLEAAERIDTPEGAAAMALARRIDAGAMTEAGSALAALVKQLHATLDAALKGAAVVADPLDELRARREARRAGNG